MEERFAMKMTGVVTAISELGGGTPTIVELEELPYRVLGALFHWLVEQLSPVEAVQMMDVLTRLRLKGFRLAMDDDLSDFA